MNPILLQPTGEAGSQVVVQGHVWKNLTAREYYENFDYLSSKVDESYTRLAAKHEFIVMEGAGSVAELNLRRTDLVNLGLAQKVNAPVLLVGDIDRGGIFASIYGTIALLLSRRSRAHPRLCRESLSRRSILVHQRRDDPGREDGQALPRSLPLRAGHSLGRRRWHVQGPLAAAPGRRAIDRCPRIPRISNVTDFRLLPWATWIERPSAKMFDTIILPGTKNTLGDLEWMKVARSRPVGSGTARKRCARNRNLRRLSDARTARRRPTWRRVFARRIGRARTTPRHNAP